MGLAENIPLRRRAIVTVACNHSCVPYCRLPSSIPLLPQHALPRVGLEVAGRDSITSIVILPGKVFLPSFLPLQYLCVLDHDVLYMESILDEC